MYSPLEQFKITRYIDLMYKNLDFTINNVVIIMSLSLFLFLMYIYIISNNKLYTNKIYYLFVKMIVELNINVLNVLSLKANQYFVFVINIFLFIFISNNIGLIPYSFTTTSQIIITIILSSTIMLSVTIIGLLKHGYKFIFLFIPKGVPILLIPYIFIIELISYLSRVLSLSVRLTTNMIAGHVLLYIIACFGIVMNI